MIKTVRAVFLVALAVAGSVLVGSGTANAAPTCTSVSVGTSENSGRFSGQKCRDGSYIGVNGTVYDQRADGQCVYISVTYSGLNGSYSGTDRSPRACPLGDSDTFYLPMRYGTIATISLRSVAGSS
jgi:hypothetical protein